LDQVHSAVVVTNLASHMA